ncbi:alpha-galactosidase [Nocardia rhamnosiphila]
MTSDGERARSVLFPSDAAPGDTTLVLTPDGVGGLPIVSWLGTLPVAEDPDSLGAVGAGGCSLLPEHSRGWYFRPGLRGHRLATYTGPDGLPPAGRDWSSAFRLQATEAGPDRLRITATDESAGLALATEIESLPGGSLRLRHCLTNTGADPYVVDRLEVVLPLPETFDEVLDFTGRWGRERLPQRRRVADGLWLRENRRGKTGLDSATLVIAGTPGFDFEHGEVVGVHVAWSGNSVHRVERTAASPTTLGGGELLFPGELVLEPGETYDSPWVHVAACSTGLDGLAAAFHEFQRSLPAHPAIPRPVNLNVWEAVYFVHDLDQLTRIADIAAELGVERYVLDDGWFRGRRHDKAGLGDWYVDEDIWPEGLDPLIDHVRALGMRFGLWFEPEMVNPDSQLYREHPEWVLSAGGRTPQLERNQLVLDLSRPEVIDYLLDRIGAILSAHDISYVKWDHNRDLLEAGTSTRHGAPAVHANTLGYYRLLDTLRERYPYVEWESCASGGGRIDLEVLRRVQRVWTSDMTDALARQSIQRWTTQLVAPEYLGAHISAPVSHQTRRVFSLDFRAATALFGDFGIEWDLTTTTAEERVALADWIAVYKRYRELLHTGRVVRVASPDPVVWAHGVLARDRRSALMAQVTIDESSSQRPPRLRVPGLDPTVRYSAYWVGPVPGAAAAPYPSTVHPVGPLGENTALGHTLASVGLPMPARHPHTVTLVEVTAIDRAQTASR